MNNNHDKNYVTGNVSKRIIGVASALWLCALCAMAVGYCMCDHVHYWWGTGTTVCYANGYPSCGPSEGDHLGCYHCTSATLELPYSCDDGTTGTMEVYDCTTDDSGFCGELLNC